ncbi:hypothetical protein EDD99_6122 [Streptomyces sp. 846.5]|nr:hypothetical protein EDD99_6122 [Streptomyces sp. 846.5]
MNTIDPTGVTFAACRAVDALVATHDLAAGRRCAAPHHR